MKRNLLLLLISVFLSFSYNIIQAGTTGKLTGKVIDKTTGDPLPFVNITIEGTMLGAATDIDGRYVILNIPPGKYNVHYQYIGYQPLIVEDIQISIDLTTTQDAALSESAVELGAVVVQGNVDKIQKDVTSSQSRVTADQIQNLPVAEINDILQMQSGVTKGAEGDFHIRGGRSSEIAYWVNGVSITDAYDNSRGIEIDNSSVQELQVISGTFNAEYGQALSGIVNTVTKEGGPKYKGDVKVYGSDHSSTFTDYFPGTNRFDPFRSYDFQGSLSGPVPITGNAITFFITGRYNYDDGYLYGWNDFNLNGTPGDSSLTPMNWSKRYIGQANISYFASSKFKFNFELLYSKEDYRDYEHAYKLEPDGDVKKYTNSYNATFTVTHTFASTAFYTLKGSYFFKDFNEHLFDNPLDPRYMHPDSLNTINYAFHDKGTNPHRFFRETNTALVKWDFTDQMTDNHLVKLGVEGRFHDVKFDDYKIEPLKVNGVPVDPFQPAVPDVGQSNRVKYDNKPTEFSAYVQDKIEFQSVIINIGLRFDYFNSHGKVPIDQTDPNVNIPLRDEYKNLSLDERQQYYYKDASAKSAFGPRFGIAYPISATGVLHFSYGQFFQVPSFQYLFQNGLYNVGETGENYGPFGNADLNPQRTTMYEIGFKQQFENDYLVDVTAFYRDIRDWITASPLIFTKNLVSYSKFINKDYSNVRGITLDFRKLLSNMFSIDLTYTYQVAEGSNSKPEDEFDAAKGNSEPAIFLIPVNWDQRNLLNLNVFVGQGDWGVSLLARYGTGLPYTPSVTQFTADRGITSGLQRNSRRSPAQFSLDLRLFKTINIYGLDVTTFLNVFNLLDNRIPQKVFGDTGEPDYTTEADNVGYDPARPNTVAEYLKYPDHYAEPRNIQLGFEFSF